MTDIDDDPAPCPMCGGLSTTGHACSTVPANSKQRVWCILCPLPAVRDGMCAEHRNWPGPATAYEDAIWAQHNRAISTLAEEPITMTIEPTHPHVAFAKLYPEAIIPTRATPGSAGLDLYLHRPHRMPLFIRPGEHVEARTGLQVIIPPGYEGQVRPRSGLALRRGVTVLNAPGTIDFDYRGELVVLLINHSQRLVELDPDERIAQIVVAPVAVIEVVEVEPQPADTDRTGGFGSTGR